MKILLVENEPDISRLISYVLASHGHTVVPAWDAPQAEAKIREGGVDVVLLDLMLPGEDGYSFCRRLKRMEDTRDVPVIIVSARVMPEEIQRGLDCGAAGYITKPYNPMTLSDEIGRISAAANGSQAPEKA